MPWVWRGAGYLVFVSLWIWASGRVLPAFMLPTPWAIFEAIWANLISGELAFHFGRTLEKLAIGFVITFVLGSVVGVAMERRFWDRFFGEPVIGAMSTPGLVFALTAGVIFGVSFWSPVVAIVVTSIPFVIVNIAAGSKTVPRDLIEMANAYGVRERDRVRHVLLPHIAPFTFAAVRYGFAASWKVAMITEVFSGADGIGFMMRLGFLRFSMAEMISWAVAFFIFALFLEKIVLERIERRFFRWRQQVVAS